MGEAARVFVRPAPPSLDVQLARYPVIGLPPLEGARNETVMRPFPAVTVGVAGRPGTVNGTTRDDEADAGPGPLMFDASTVHVYDFPFDNAVTVIGDDDPFRARVVPPFEDAQVAVYPVIAEPPSNGATNVTRMLAFPTETVGWAGASGTAFGTVDAEAEDARPSPSTFDANTVQVYVLPFVSADTVSGDDAPDT
jgi:hypothetical protein